MLPATVCAEWSLEEAIVYNHNVLVSSASNGQAANYIDGYALLGLMYTNNGA